MPRKTSYATMPEIPTGVLGQIHRGIPISEDTRVSTWETRAAAIKMLERMLESQYNNKKVRAVLFGVYDAHTGVTRYAIFVQTPQMNLSNAN